MKNYVQHHLERLDKVSLAHRCRCEGLENVVVSMQIGYFKVNSQETLPTEELKQGYRRYRKSNVKQRQNCIRAVLKEVLK